MYFKVSEYLWYTYTYLYKLKATYMRYFIIPVITLCMPAESFVVYQKPFPNSLNPDEDQQIISLELDPNCLTLRWWSCVVYL